MDMNNYQELALRSESPIGDLTAKRMAQLYDHASTKMEQLRVIFADDEFDKIKRKVFYGDPGLTLPKETIQDARFWHGFIGLITELKELIDLSDKSIQIDPVHLLEELGDLLWYIALIADSHGIPLADIADRNIAKLKTRYPDKFKVSDAEVRDLEKERITLEGHAGCIDCKKVIKHMTSPGDVGICTNCKRVYRADTVEDWLQIRYVGSYVEGLGLGLDDAGCSIQIPVNYQVSEDFQSRDIVKLS